MNGWLILAALCSAFGVLLMLTGIVLALRVVLR